MRDMQLVSYYTARSYDTGGRGLLNVLNEEEFPFPVKRIFWITNTEALAKRGGHAHREGKQLIFPMSGLARVKSFGPGGAFNKWQLREPDMGLYVPPMTWLDIRMIFPDTSLLVLASNAYAESDYIRDWAEFQALACPVQ
jgi:hypothetical protein